MDFEALMREALREAAFSGSEVPVGALVVDRQGNILTSSSNKREACSDPTAHAEIAAIRQAGKLLGSWRLEEMTLIVTLEPCVMCAGAIRQSRLERVVFGAWESRVGAGGSLYDILRDSNLGQPLEVIGGVLERECRQSLEEFFKELR